MSEEEKEAKREYGKIGYKNMTENQATPKKMRKWNSNFLGSIKMSKRVLKFDNIEVNKKKFDVSKQPITLNLVNVDQILISDKFKHSDTGFKYFIGYKDDNIVRSFALFYLKWMDT